MARTREQVLESAIEASTVHPTRPVVTRSLSQVRRRTAQGVPQVYLDTRSHSRTTLSHHNDFVGLLETIRRLMDRAGV